MTELWIQSNYDDSWVKCDCLDDFNYSFNYSVSDLSKPDQRKSSFSKTIKLPATHTNNRLFTHIYEVGQYGNFDPNKKALCKILNSGAEIFKGYARIISIVKIGGLMTYEINVVSDTGDFFSSLGELTLTDIDYGFYTDRSLATQMSTWSNTSVSASPCVFPMINNGRHDLTGASPTVYADDFTPAIFCKTVLDKIFSDAGYSYTSSFFTSADFTDHFIIPSLPAYGDIPLRRIRIDYNFSVTNSSGTTQAMFIYFKRVPIVSVEYNLETILVAAVPASTTTVYAGTVYADLEYLDEIYIKASGTSLKIDAGSTLVITDEDNGVTGVTNTVSVKNNADYSMVGGIIPFDAISSGTGNWDTANYWLVGGEIDFSNYLPDQVKQKDFIMGLVRMFNLYIEVDKTNNKNLLIEPRKDFYTAGSTQDWSKKLDESKEFVILPMGLLDANEYELKHKSDGDFLNKQVENNFGYGYGRYLKSVDNDFVKNRTTIETIFSPTVLRQNADNDVVVSTIIQDDPNLSSTNQTSNVIKGNIRLLYYQEVTTTTTISYTDDTTTTPTNNLCYAGHLDHPTTPTYDYQFGTPDVVYFTITAASYPTSNLYSRHYYDMISEITDRDSKIIQCSLYLTPHDVQKINFRDKYFIDGQYYLLNKVIDYNPNSNQSTKVELLKLKSASAYSTTIKKIKVI